MPKKKTTKKSAVDIDHVACDITQKWKQLSRKELADIDKHLDEAYPGGFNQRDEANALIAAAVRNGPIENLHAGKHSALLKDASLSRITDDEMKMLMIAATQKLAELLRFRDKDPKGYRRLIRSYGMIYCQSWQREK